MPSIEAWIALGIVAVYVYGCYKLQEDRKDGRRY